MRTETWYYCGRGCGYKTQDKDDMEKHEMTCAYEQLPLWQVTVYLDIDQEPTFRVETPNTSVVGKKELDRYLSRVVEVEYAFRCGYYFARKFVRTEAEVPAALAECKAKMREWLLHLAGEVDGL